MNVQPSDEGDYVCRGNNIVDQAEEIIQIDVQGTVLETTCLTLNMYPGGATCIRIHICRRTHVAGYMLLVRDTC